MDRPCAAACALFLKALAARHLANRAVLHQRETVRQTCLERRKKRDLRDVLRVVIG